MELVTREEWGARDPRTVTLLEIPTKDLILHHSVSDGDGGAHVRAIQNYHMDVKGWRDIAYHYLIDSVGKVYEGRTGGVEGGATYGQNQTSHAICFLGNFQTETPTAMALDALIELVPWGHDQGWWPNQITGGHRDFRDTTCPGDNLYELIPQINQEIEMAFTPHEEQQLKKLVAEIDSVGSDAGFLSELIEDIRKDVITRNELLAALKKLPPAATVDQVIAELVKRLAA